MKDDVFVDPKLDAELDRVLAEMSARGLQFTENQLYTAWCGQRFVDPLPAWGLTVFLGLFVPVLAWVGASPGVGFAVVLLAGFFGTTASRRQNDRALFEGVLLGRASTRGEIEGLIRHAQLLEQRNDELESDVYEHTVGRVLIVDDDRLVDLLVVNGFAAQNQVLVISERGYPHHLVELANRSMALPGCTILMLEAYRAGPSYSIGKRTTEAGALKVPITYTWAGLSSSDLGFFRDDLRAVPEARSARVPVDLIPYDVLTSVLARCLIADKSISAVLTPPPRPASQPTYGGGIGFG